MSVSKQGLKHIPILAKQRKRFEQFTFDRRYYCSNSQWGLLQRQSGCFDGVCNFAFIFLLFKSGQFYEKVSTQENNK